MTIRFIVGLGLLALCGCFFKPAGDPNLKTSKVTGSVTVDGQPAGLLTVEFHPESGTSKIDQPVTVMTDAEGEFNVKMPQGNEGLPAGTYFVVFKWQTMIGKRDDRLKGAYKETYKDPTKSTFKVTIEERTPQDLEPFELSTKPKK